MSDGGTLTLLATKWNNMVGGVKFVKVVSSWKEAFRVCACRKQHFTRCFFAIVFSKNKTLPEQNPVKMRFKQVIWYLDKFPSYVLSPLSLFPFLYTQKRPILSPKILWQLTPAFGLRLFTTSRYIICRLCPWSGYSLIFNIVFPHGVLMLFLCINYSFVLKQNLFRNKRCILIPQTCYFYVAVVQHYYRIE